MSVSEKGTEVKDSKIEWTTHTFNPWWGCVEVSPACDHCYAREMDARFHIIGQRHWGKYEPRKFFGEKHWAQPLAWNRSAAKRGVRERVFCGSMCDVMEDRRDLGAPRGRLYGLVDTCCELDFLFLTKRPQNFRKLLPADWLSKPRPNVWLLTTVESNEYRWRIMELLRVPAVVHGISAEPLLGPLDIAEYLDFGYCGGGHRTRDGRVTWAIVGGESGLNARPSHPDWIASLRDQCVKSGTAFFFKQWGTYAPITFDDRHGANGNKDSVWIHPDGFTSPRGEVRDFGWPMAKMRKKGGRLLDGREWNEFPEVR